MANGKSKSGRLVLIQGGAAEGIGPVTRLGLWDRVPGPSRKQWVLLIIGKGALAATLIYFLWFR